MPIVKRSNKPKNTEQASVGNWWDNAADAAPKKAIPDHGLLDRVAATGASLRSAGYLLAHAPESLARVAWTVKDIVRNLRTPHNPANHIEVRYRARVRNRGTAITAFCVDCKGFKRKNVTECSNVDCPLWAFRFGSDPFYKRR